MISGSNEQMKQQQMVYNTGINLHQKQFDFTEYWNKKQRSYEVAGNVLNYFGNTLSGAATGMMGGGKIGGMPGAVIGGVAGALGGIFGAVGESVRLDFENKNRIAGLNLERQVF